MVLRVKNLRDFCSLVYETGALNLYKMLQNLPKDEQIRATTLMLVVFFSTYVTLIMCPTQKLFVVMAKIKLSR